MTCILLIELHRSCFASDPTAENIYQKAAVHHEQADQFQLLERVTSIK